MITKLCDYTVHENAVSDFSDVKGHWAQKYIVSLKNTDIINGYDDGTFKPDAFITRAEAVKMINYAIKRNYRVAEETGFVDVPRSHWAYDEIIKTVN